MPTPLHRGDPTRLGRYDLLARLGQGGMGTVFLGRGPDGMLVAVKVIRPEFAHDQRFRARFRGEVSRARQVPGFCTAEVLDADPDHPTPFLVVEYVDGPSLYDVVSDNGPVRGGSLHSVAVGVAAALAAIHGAGVIHRDLKPRNVLFSLGTPKVIDFGISRGLEATSQLTRPEEMVGTVAYMAPERIEGGREPTPAVDVFAWGAVVAYAGTGRSPFGGDSPISTAMRILSQPPQLDGLPPHLAGLVTATLAKDPADRPTAPELLSRLLAAGSSGASASLTIPDDLRRTAEAAQHTGRTGTGGSGFSRVLVSPLRRRLAVAAAGLGALAVVAGVALAANRADNDRQGPILTGAPSVSASAAPEVVAGPAIFDSLRRSGDIGEMESTAGNCTYDDGLRVTSDGGADPMQCLFGLREVFPAQQSIDLRATLGSKQSCAAVWFRVPASGGNATENQLRGYLLSVCSGQVSLEVDDLGQTTVITKADRATEVDKPHRILLVAEERKATVSIDGEPVLDAPLTVPTLPGGSIVLGARSEAGSKAEVTFTDARFRSGTAPDQPAIPAFATGDAVLNARLWFFHRDAGSAIVEPAEFPTGEAYCQEKHLPRTDEKCSQKTVTVASSLRVSLPIAKGITLREFRDGHPECVDRTTHAGQCSVKSRDDLSSWMTMNSPFPARLTVKNGEITALATLDLP